MSWQKRVGAIGNWILREDSDPLILAGTPRVFEWLKWAATLGALRYVAIKGHSVTLTWIVGGCTFLLLMYFTSFFDQLVKAHFSKLHQSRLLAIIPALMVGILAWGTNYFIVSAIDDYVNAQPPQQQCK